MSEVSATLFISDLSDITPIELSRLQYWQCNFDYNPNLPHKQIVIEGKLVTNIPLPDQIKSAVPKRQAEYLAGRICAGNALASAGAYITDVPTAPDRAPVWPVGYVGSITHSHGIAAAIVAWGNDYIGLGIDRETYMSPSKADKLQKKLIIPLEASMRPNDMTFSIFLTLIFSAKEALYKAVHPQLKTPIGFHDAICLSVEGNRIRLKLTAPSHTQIYEVHFHLDQTACTCICALKTGSTI